ncbi:hypothetical protein MBM_00747 [Drepanopeziza brunnea f. sp. 'multigermtubi' MB_m1]|uniref:Uncharacterized protein n=1 Tax=Marssonina brunnea f. sp. multigermtubi (strain MB_m1) TaxID=1072389 RepID=K1Y936_MARBU|nr:uncharacterized protein MBM_00747 [Drepanopeziza brunnea f. sp. 'multigermtubi' MB_m1]EKD21634.1 hypothetical protein MBM_00747 [Drepanopeziza brunnea f. sp. 'multigermtubi' MB_m1]
MPDARKSEWKSERMRNLAAVIDIDIDPDGVSTFNRETRISSAEVRVGKLDRIGSRTTDYRSGSGRLLFSQAMVLAGSEKPKGAIFEAEDFVKDGTSFCLKISMNIPICSLVFRFTRTGPEVYGNWYASSSKHLTKTEGKLHHGSSL